jgi:hypothetical protein
MTARKAVATLCLIAALAGGTTHAAAQSATASPSHIAAAYPADAASPGRSASFGPGLQPQTEPLMLALFGAGAIGLALVLRRFLPT